MAAACVALGNAAAVTRQRVTGLCASTSTTDRRSTPLRCTRVKATTAASVADAVVVRGNPNPLAGVSLLTVDGVAKPVPFWPEDQRAAELAQLKPELDAAGVLLVVVGVGTPESAKQFAEALPFPGEALFVDPERAAYKALSLHGDLDGTEGIFFDPKVVEGVRRLFFTKITGEKIKARGTEGIKAAMKNYKPLMPPKSIDSVQQGGTVVFRGHEVVYLRRDEATADHAPAGEVMEAVSRASRCDTCEVPEAA